MVKVPFEHGYLATTMGDTMDCKCGHLHVLRAEEEPWPWPLCRGRSWFCGRGNDPEVHFNGFGPLRDIQAPKSSKFVIIVLQMRHCGIYTFPPSLPSFTDLVDLDISENKLSILSPSICRMRTLTTLNIEENRIVRLPGGLAQMPSLRVLSIGGNELSWLPSTFHITRPIYIDGLTNNRFWRHTDVIGRSSVTMSGIFAQTLDRLRVFADEFAEAAIGLQDLELPALVTLEILDALCPNAVRMAAKWDLIVAVKHFRRH
jgi:hypothetical protein